MSGDWVLWEFTQSYLVEMIVVLGFCSHCATVWTESSGGTCSQLSTHMGVFFYSVFAVCKCILSVFDVMGEEQLLCCVCVLYVCVLGSMCVVLISVFPSWQLWDIGGQPRFRSMWERYCRGVSAIV